jgi:hypothetical protein
MGERTDLYMFGCGLGDQAAIEQMGTAFLKHIDEHGDPELGRIMITVGSGRTAFMPYRGDFNLHWVIGFSNTVNWLPIYLNEISVTPSLFLSPSKIIGEQIEDVGFENLYFPLACGDVFRPLGLPRHGLGFTGLDSKPPHQRNAILGPMLGREDFEWRGRNLNEEEWNPTQISWLHLYQLNEWYNSKQAVFGMFFEESLELGLVTGRVFETLGSGTPLICFRNPAIDEVIGSYSWQSETAEETMKNIDYILNHPKEINDHFLKWSHEIHRSHSYDVRIRTLIERLQEMK